MLAGTPRVETKPAVGRDGPSSYIRFKNISHPVGEADLAGAAYQRGSTRSQLGSTCWRISATSSRLRKGIFA